MKLILALLFFSSAAIIYKLALLDSEKPEQSRWCGDFLVANVLAPLITGLIALGVTEILHVAFSFDAKGFTAREIAPATVIVLLSFICYRWMGRRRTLAQRKREEETAPSHI